MTATRKVEYCPRCEPGKSVPLGSVNILWNVCAPCRAAAQRKVEKPQQSIDTL
jgi:hypothetical protein